MHTLATEAFWLAVTTLMTASFWIPYIANRIAERGLRPALQDPQGDTHARAAWADRMARAHRNAVENLCVYAPLVLLVVMFGKGSSATQWAAQTYFVVRLAHFVVFSAGLPYLRVPAFVAGYGCQLVMAAALLT